MRRHFLTLIAATLVFTMAPEAIASLPQRESDAVRLREEGLDPFRQWLDEDVLYIITAEERSVFESLTTAEEREHFIEQFWRRRDPDPATEANEFREEHYRRIAYANERFSSGSPGWKTDRGRIYIIHGPPDGTERHAAGGPYIRRPEEGGGATTTYPFERWWYRHMEGLGEVELEFVDPSFTGEYRLAMDPVEKDALKFIPGLGLTESELLGETTKADRPYYFSGAYENRIHYHFGYENDPFRRLERFFGSQRPRPIQYRDLQQVVDVDITYEAIPFRVRADYFRLDDRRVLVPITVELDNRELTFTKEGNGRVARVAIYGIVTSITGQVVSEFDDDLVSPHAAGSSEPSLRMRSAYQKLLLLDGKLRYRIDLVVMDVHSGKIGVERRAITPPRFDRGTLASSSLVLADVIFLPEDPKPGEMFLLGDVKVRPNVRRAFPRNNPIGVYLQLYSVAFDETTFSPSLRIAYRLLRDGEPIWEEIDEGGVSLQYASPERVVLIRGVPTGELAPGFYRIQVEVRDGIGDRSILAEDEIEIEAPLHVARR